MPSIRNTKNTVAVFGSAFNPPHNGHGDVIRQALEQFQSVLLVPSYCHAFGKIMAPFDQRLTMTISLAESIHQQDRVKVSDIEREIAKKHKPEQAIYTYDLLEALQQRLPSSVITFVLGPDNAKPEIWNTFYRAQDILKRWQIWQAQERLPIRSTAIRNNLSRGSLPTEEQCPLEVINQLKAHPFYIDNADSHG